MGVSRFPEPTTLSTSAPTAVDIPGGWGSKIQKALSEASTRLVRVKQFGDSIGSGYSAGAFADTYFEKFVDHLKTIGGDGGTGLLTSNVSPTFSEAYGTTQLVARITMANKATWQPFTQGYGGSTIMNYSADVLTIANARGRTIDIYYESYAAGPLVTVKINGSTVGTIDTNAAALNRKWTFAVPGETVDGYTITLECPIYTIFHAIDIYNATGVTGHNMAKAGATAIGYNGEIMYTGGAASGLYAATDDVPCDLLIMEYSGANEANQGVSIADYRSHVATVIVANRKVRDCDVICIASSPQASADPANQYWIYPEALAEIAEANGAAFLNMWREFPRIDADKYASGLYTSADATHPNTLGHAWIADQLIALVSAGLTETQVALLRGADGVSGLAALQGLATAKGSMFVASAAGIISETLQQSAAQVPISAPNDPNGLIWASPMITKRLFVWHANPAANTATSIGAPAVPTLTATASNADDAEGPWVNHATTAVSNNASGVVEAFTYFRPGWVPDAEIKIKTAAALTNMRIIVGLVSASPDTVPTPTTLHGAWFRYDTSVDGTAFWRTCTGAGAAPTVTTTTQSIATDTQYKLRIEFVGVSGSNPTAVRFLINDVVVATHTATLPAANQTMGRSLRVTTLAAATKNLKWSKFAVAAF
jgi:hypothetical protein